VVFNQGDKSTQPGPAVSLSYRSLDLWYLYRTAAWTCGIFISQLKSNRCLIASLRSGESLVSCLLVLTDAALAAYNGWEKALNNTFDIPESHQAL
jgi:hypothetical protein